MASGNGHKTTRPAKTVTLPLNGGKVTISAPALSPAELRLVKTWLPTILPALAATNGHNGTPHPRAVVEGAGPHHGDPGTLHGH